MVGLLLLFLCHFGLCWNDLDAIGFNYTTIDNYIKWCKGKEFPCNFEIIDYIIRGFGIWLCMMQAAMLVINWYLETPSTAAPKITSTEDAQGLGSMEPLSPMGNASAEARANAKVKSIEQVTAVPTNPSSEKPSREDFIRRVGSHPSSEVVFKTAEKTEKSQAKDTKDDISPEGIQKEGKSEDKKSDKGKEEKNKEK